MLSQRLGAAEVPGRLPARPDLADPGRADGRAPSRTSPAAGCCSTSSPAARATSSARTATSSTRTSATSAATSSSTIVRRLWTGETVDFDGRAPPGRGRRARSSSPTRSRRSTSAAPRRPPADVAAKHADVYLTWGEPPAAVAEKIALDPRARRASRAASSASASACTPSPATPPRRPGPRPTACSTGIDDDDDRRRSRTGLKRSESEGQQRMLALNGGCTRRPRDLPQPLGRRRPGPRRRRHRAGRQPRARSPTGSRSTPRSASTSSCSRLPAPRGAPTGSARACCPMLEQRGLWTHPAPGRRHRVGAVRRASGPRHDAPASPSWSATPSRARAPSRPRLHLADRAGRRRPRRRPGRPSARSCSTGRTPRVTELVERGRRRRLWSSSPARPTRRPTPGCSRSFLDRFAAAPGLAASPRTADARRRRRSTRSRPSTRCARCSSSSARRCRPAGSTSSTPSTTTPRRTTRWLATAQPLLPTLPAPARTLTGVVRMTAPRLTTTQRPRPRSAPARRVRRLPQRGRRRRGLGDGAADRHRRSRRSPR